MPFSNVFLHSSQVLFRHSRTCAYAVMVNDSVLLRCMTGPINSGGNMQLTNCHSSSVVALRQGDQVWLKDMYQGDMASLWPCYVHVGNLSAAVTEPGQSTFWGMVKLQDL